MMGEVWVFTLDFQRECGSQTGPKDQLGQMTEMTAWHLCISTSRQISAMCASGGLWCFGRLIIGAFSCNLILCTLEAASAGPRIG